MNKVASNYEQSWRRKDLPEGLSGEMFSLEVKQYIEGELGIPLSQDLINGLFKHADVNHDDKVLIFVYINYCYVTKLIEA